MLNEKIRALLDEIENGKGSEGVLPQQTFYLKDEKILSLPRKLGESRFPYDADGFVVWAYQTGFISACDSTFTVFKSANYGEEPVINFFGGLEDNEGKFFPVSVLGGARQLIEPDDVKRYVVFSLRCVYYIADTKDVTFAVRMNVTKEKTIHFSVCAENKSAETKKIYLASFFEALLRFTESEGFWDKMSKFGSKEGENFILWSRNGKEDCLVVNPHVSAGKVTGKSTTVSRNDFCGYKGRTIANAESLRQGSFEREVPFVNTTDLPIASEIIHFELGTGEACSVEYDIHVCHGMDAARQALGKTVSHGDTEAAIDEWENADKDIFDNMVVAFDDLDYTRTTAEVFNKFVRNVQKQVSFCALGKNYAGPHIGIRDVFQQLEGSLMWDPEKRREKILVAMNYIMDNGRAPRQFSVPHDPNVIPEFNLRMYIDQGVWVISTIYTYICHTGDYSILDEECGYYKLINDKAGIVEKSEVRDSVLCHMVRIMEFLESKLDEKTMCMRALYGDWNDALDGLGRTTDEGRDYGDGVSVMTTLQFYQNLAEMDALLTKLGKKDDAAHYSELRGRVEAGLIKWALEEKDGRYRVIHGWGDKMSYKVGSFCDCDGVDRYSLTANSFWAISGMLNAAPEAKDSIHGCFDAVDSKYGLKTFSAPFTIEYRPQIGRLATITEGTYENCCAYVHASMFGIMAMFLIGESKRAWEEIEKSIVITHDNCTMTSFVMPNSYCHNDSLYIDGVSMGDWYTGSGTMFVKELIRFGFGIEPTLDALKIQTPAYMPTKSASVSMKIKGKAVSLGYENRGNGRREIFVDGNKAESRYDEMMKTEVCLIPQDEIHDGMTVLVTD